MLGNILMHTAESYSKNFIYITFFSIAFFIALIIPMLISAPTYVALGAIYLRTGSIPALGYSEILVLAAGFLGSYILLATGLVAISVVVKAQRTLKKVSEEVVKGLQRYVLNVLWLYVAVTFFLIAAAMLLYELGAQFIFPVVQIITGMYVLMVPIAIVIDDIDVIKAFGRATSAITARAVDLTAMMICLLLLMALVYGIMLILLPHTIAVYLYLLINGLALSPILIMVSIHTYLSKYPVIY
ncbi:hypothetical protein COT30_00175 [Candidatus Micrarchaeota archaeon CG08_land_8_20_14_0_20_49_17]|nr:MAG: hypothetical protein AUJ13_02715 [Candidatus Micrarchaeota archaeon CG1_02_49_24]PIU10271.1 MAG: hypothetical protein COT30_00175 [Candidatus Micrarchaeota archaeon CG08_land_8_20_14_0_20_49_17]PIZ97020.1 MAG: hypothetical protein COX84_03445 [Candidatus Micrarchaeota archaeon CG_4_10_14_0_2_um_filter_49_7]HII54284.1 hypothetical protein [Candidatus Micrarchaeota archaeon]